MLENQVAARVTGLTRVEKKCTVLLRMVSRLHDGSRTLLLYSETREQNSSNRMKIWSRGRSVRGALTPWLEQMACRSIAARSRCTWILNAILISARLSFPV